MSSNFLVIETKRDKPHKIEDVIRRIRENWFQGPERYQFGAAVNLNADKSHFVEVDRKNRKPN